MDSIQAVPCATLISPYKGALVDLLVSGEERLELIKRANQLPSIQLSARSLCDLELLATGALSPLDRFMSRADYGRVLDDMRLENGTLFPIPVTLPLPDASTHIGADIALRSLNNDVVAIMTIEEIYERDDTHEALRVLGTTDARHPFVAEMAAWPKYAASGPLQVLNLPQHHDFADLRRGPADVREALSGLGWKNVVAFQTRNPIHRAQEEATRRAAKELHAALLIHPVVGMSQAGDVDHYARLRSYKILVERYYDVARTLLRLLPLAVRKAGPREALWHAIICRNYGANHLIVERDHGGAGNSSQGHPFYGPSDARDLIREFESEIGVKAVPLKDLVYLPDEDRYEESDRIPAQTSTASLSNAEIQTAYLSNGKKLPSWFTRPETAAILSRVSPPKHQRGFCLWLTGLSGAGKSSTAGILVRLLMQYGRQVTLLDGDVVRTHLSNRLGFSKEDRDINVRRIGFVAAEIVHHHGVAICAAVSPYKAARNECRSMASAGRFIEVFVDTPIEVCEQRDTKGMYARARRGEIKKFTGVDDPYERPDNPEIRLTTTDASPEENASRVLQYLIENGFLLNDADERNFL